MIENQETRRKEIDYRRQKNEKHSKLEESTYTDAGICVDVVDKCPILLGHRHCIG
jgi:hypothetical protein